MTLAMQLIRVNVDKIESDYCTFGHLKTREMKIVFNNAFRFGMKDINKQLAEHPLTIPSQLGRFFALSDLTIGYQDNFLEIGLTPTFIGPTTSVFT